MSNLLLYYLMKVRAVKPDPFISAHLYAQAQDERE